MADGTIAIDEPATVDKMLDTESLTVGANTVQRERVVIAGLAAADLCPVDATAGVKVNLGVDNDVTVTGTVTANLAAGTNNIGDVDVLSLPALAAGTNNIGDVDVLTVNGVAPAFGTGLRGATVQRVTIATDDSVPVTGTFWQATQPVSGTVTANLAAGTNNIGDIDILSIAAGDNNIGNVDVVTLPNVTLAAGTNTNEVVGDAAHDAAVAGNPVLVGGAAQDTDDTAPPNRVSAEGDATRFATDRDGAQFVRPHGPQVWSYHSNGSSALTDATVHAAPGAGLSLYVTDIIVSSGAATAMNVFFKEGASTVLGPWYLEAVAGRGLEVHFVTPKKITPNTALTVTTSAAIAHAVDVTGFTAQG